MPRSPRPPTPLFHSVCWATCSVFVCSFVPCPSARLRGFPAVPTRRTALLHPSEICLASLGALAPPRTSHSLFISVLLGVLGFLFVQVPPRSRAEFLRAAGADKRGHYPSPRLRRFGFFPPLHFLLQASRFCLMLGYRCFVRSSVFRVFPRIFPRPKRGYAHTHRSLSSANSWACPLRPSSSSCVKICVTVGYIGLMFVQVFPRIPRVFPAL